MLSRLEILPHGLKKDTVYIHDVSKKSSVKKFYISQIRKDTYTAVGNISGAGGEILMKAFPPKKKREKNKKEIWMAFKNVVSNGKLLFSFYNSSGNLMILDSLKQERIPCYYKHLQIDVRAFCISTDAKMIFFANDLEMGILYIETMHPFSISTKQLFAFYEPNIENCMFCNGNDYIIVTQNTGSTTEKIIVLNQKTMLIEWHISLKSKSRRQVILLASSRDAKEVLYINDNHVYLSGSDKITRKLKNSISRNEQVGAFFHDDQYIAIGKKQFVKIFARQCNWKPVQNISCGYSVNFIYPFSNKNAFLVQITHTGTLEVTQAQGEIVKKIRNLAYSKFEQDAVISPHHFLLPRKFCMHKKRIKIMKKILFKSFLFAKISKYHHKDIFSQINH